MSRVDSFLFYNTVRELSSARERHSKSFSGLWTKQTDWECNQRDRTWAAYLQRVQPPVFVSSSSSWSSTIDVHVGPFQKDLWVLKLTTGKQIVCHQHPAGRQPIRLLVTWWRSYIRTERTHPCRYLKELSLDFNSLKCIILMLALERRVLCLQCWTLLEGQEKENFGPLSQLQLIIFSL